MSNIIGNIMKYKTLSTALQKAERFFTFPDVNTVPYIDMICTVESVSKDVQSKLTKFLTKKTIISGESKWNEILSLPHDYWRNN